MREHQVCGLKPAHGIVGFAQTDAYLAREAAEVGARHDDELQRHAHVVGTQVYWLIGHMISRIHGS
jgi:hypothetical protein